MATPYQSLQTSIVSYVKDNTNNEIGGTGLQQRLLNMIAALGAEGQFMGVITTAKNIGKVPDGKQLYIATNLTTNTQYTITGDGSFSCSVPAGNMYVIHNNSGYWVAERIFAVMQQDQSPDAFGLLGIITKATDIGLVNDIKGFYIAYNASETRSDYTVTGTDKSGLFTVSIKQSTLYIIDSLTRSGYWTANEISSGILKYLERQISGVATTASNAQAAASNAQTAASNAATIAGNAQTAASNAATIASNAQTTASSAKAAARDAENIALEAKEAALSANDTANLAVQFYEGRSIVSVVSKTFEDCIVQCAEAKKIELSYDPFIRNQIARVENDAYISLKDYSFCRLHVASPQISLGVANSNPTRPTCVIIEGLAYKIMAISSWWLSATSLLLNTPHIVDISLVVTEIAKAAIAVYVHPCLVDYYAKTYAGIKFLPMTQPPHEYF